jgi:hypothetical protein
MIEAPHVRQLPRASAARYASNLPLSVPAVRSCVCQLSLAWHGVCNHALIAAQGDLGTLMHMGYRPYGPARGRHLGGGADGSREPGGCCCQMPVPRGAAALTERGTAMDADMIFMDCPAYMDKHGAVRCGLPAEVEHRYTVRSSDAPLECAKIRCPRGHRSYLPSTARVVVRGSGAGTCMATAPSRSPANGGLSPAAPGLGVISAPLFVCRSSPWATWDQTSREALRGAFPWGRSKERPVRPLTVTRHTVICLRELTADVREKRSRSGGGRVSGLRPRSWP